jgi:hypothetical protein
VKTEVRMMRVQTTKASVEGFIVASRRDLPIHEPMVERTKTSLRLFEPNSRSSRPSSSAEEFQAI